MDGGNGAISMNLNDQRRLKSYIFLILLKERTARVKF